MTKDKEGSRILLAKTLEGVSPWCSRLVFYFYALSSLLVQNSTMGAIVIMAIMDTIMVIMVTIIMVAIMTATMETTISTI